MYLDVDGELGTAELIAALQTLGATCHVPVLDDNRLRFAPFGDTTTWSPNRYGILEPDGTGSGFVLVEGAELDLVFVPAVAVDVRGNRVGMGAGWYDRTFAGSSTGPSDAGPTLVGFVHDEQLVDTIEPSAWDVAMHAVVTPTRLLHCSD